MGHFSDSHYSDRIVVENRGHILRREFVGSVGDQQACFAYSTVTDNHTPVKKRPQSATVYSSIALVLQRPS